MPAPWAAIAEVRIMGRIHGSNTVNVWHFATNQQAFDWTTIEPLLLELAQAMMACVVEKLLPVVSADWAATGVDAKYIAPTQTDAVVDTNVGAGVGALSPASVSFYSSLIRLRTGIGGRRGRGRKFLPPVGETEMTASGINAPQLALLADFILCVAQKFVGAGRTVQNWELVVLSRADAGGILGNILTSVRTVTQLETVAAAACMRSRKIGVGE